MAGAQSRESDDDERDEVHHLEAEQQQHDDDEEEDDDEDANDRWMMSEDLVPDAKNIPIVVWFWHWRLAVSYRQELRDKAHDNHGVITLDDARDAGVPAVEVHKLASRGVLDRVGKGVYRMVEVPADALTEFAEAVASAGADAALADDTVLAAHGLAQVNARTIRVATPHRVRAQLPPTVELVAKAVPLADLDYIDGVPAMAVTDALLASRGRVMTERLIDAARDAARRDLITEDQAQHVIEELTRQ